RGGAGLGVFPPAREPKVVGDGRGARHECIDLRRLEDVAVLRELNVECGGGHTDRSLSDGLDGANEVDESVPLKVAFAAEGAGRRQEDTFHVERLTDELTTNG